MAKINLGIHYGTLAESISAQLKAHGVRYDPKQAREFTGMADKITHLKWHGLLNDKQANSARSKLHTKVMIHVTKFNKSRNK